MSASRVFIVFRRMRNSVINKEIFAYIPTSFFYHCSFFLFFNIKGNSFRNYFLLGVASKCILQSLLKAKLSPHVSLMKYRLLNSKQTSHFLIKITNWLMPGPFWIGKVYNVSSSFHIIWNGNVCVFETRYTANLLIL